MTPDSDTYTHIIFNGLLWYGVLFGIPTARFLSRKFMRHVERRLDQRINLHVHKALHPNVRVMPTQRNAR